jgi:hypothetical protein
MAAFTSGPHPERGAVVHHLGGRHFIVRVVDESRRHATALADDMRGDVVDAAEAILQAALDHPANRQRATPRRPDP